MRIRRPGFGQQVVPVVEDSHQPEIVHRREDRGTGAGDHPSIPSADGQEPPVALGRAEIGGQRHVRPRPEGCEQCGVEPGQVPGVGNDQQRADTGAPEPTAASSASRVGQSSPGTACQTARAGRRSAMADRKAAPAG